MRSLRPSYQASAEIVARIAEGLVEVHAAGLLHRDIKPSNVVVDNDGVPKLIDFGLAAKFEDPAGRTRIGTPSYMAPEQARQDWDCMDHRTDVFSLGAVLYQLLSGKPIYTGPDKQSLIRNAQDCSIVPLRQLRPDLPRALTELCTQCLASHPLQRPKSAAELARRLRASVRYRYSPWVVAALMSIAIAMLVISLGFLRPTTSWNSQPLNSNLVDDVTTALPMPQSSIGLIAASSDDSNSLHQADSTRIDDLDWRQLHHLFTGAEMQPKAAQLQQAMDMETTAVASVDDTRAPPLSAADFWERLSRDFDSSVPKLRLENEFRVEIEISRNEDGMNDGLPRSIAYWDLKESWQPTRSFDFFVADQRVRSNVSLEIRVSAEEDCFIAIYGITIPPSTVGDAPNMEPTIDLVYPEQNVFKHASSFPAVKGVELGLTTGVDLLYVMCSTDVFDLNEPRKSDALGRSNDLRGFVRGRKISQRLYRYVVKSLDR